MRKTLSRCYYTAVCSVTLLLYCSLFCHAAIILLSVTLLAFIILLLVQLLFLNCYCLSCVFILRVLQVLDSVWGRAQAEHQDTASIAAEILHTTALERYFMSHHTSETLQSDSSDVKPSVSFLIARLLSTLVEHVPADEQEARFAPFVSKVISSITFIGAQLQQKIAQAEQAELASRLVEVAFLVDSFSRLFSFEMLTSSLAALLKISSDSAKGPQGALSSVSVSLMQSILSHSDSNTPNAHQLSKTEFAQLLHLIVSHPTDQAARVLLALLSRNSASAAGCFLGAVDVFGAIDTEQLEQMLAHKVFQKVSQWLVSCSSQHAKLSLAFINRELSSALNVMDTAAPWLEIITALLAHLPRQSGEAKTVLCKRLWPQMLKAQLSGQPAAGVSDLLATIATKQQVRMPLVSIYIDLSALPCPTATLVASPSLKDKHP